MNPSRQERRSILYMLKIIKIYKIGNKLTILSIDFSFRSRFQRFVLCECVSVSLSHYYSQTPNPIVLIFAWMFRFPWLGDISLYIRVYFNSYLLAPSKNKNDNRTVYFCVSFFPKPVYGLAVKWTKQRIPFCG